LHISKPFYLKNQGTHIPGDTGNKQYFIYNVMAHKMAAVAISGAFSLSEFGFSVYLPVVSCLISSLLFATISVWLCMCVCM